ncbi:intron Large complex component GCFC2 [Aplochiton taeniatus]
MFNKKPRRNFRQRKGDSSDEDQQKSENAEGNEPDVSSGKSLAKSKLLRPRGICSSTREGTPPKSDFNDGEDSGEDSAGSTTDTKISISKSDKGKVLSFLDDKEGGVSEFKLKKSSDRAVVFQVRTKEEGSPAKTSRPKSTVGREVTATATAFPREESDTDGSGEELSPDSNHDDGEDARCTASSPASSLSSMSSTSSVPTRVVIPDARKIQAARSQRQRARSQKDYISLGREGHGSPGTPNSHDREKQSDDDDDDDEPDDHQRRIEFAPRPKTIRERIAAKMGRSESEDSDSDSQEREDQTLWEEQQIGKGVKRVPGKQSPSGSDHSDSSRRRLKKRAAIPESLPPVTISMVKKRITGKLDSLRGVHRAREAELRRMESDMESARSALESLEDGSTDRQLRFYRATNAYVQNLVECLREKVVEVNSLEMDMHSLLSDQAEALLSRRREAVMEESSRLQQLSYTTDIKQDEDSENVIRTQTRSALGDEEDFGGPPADCLPSPEEEEELLKKREDILIRAQGVFSDVQEDFWDVKKVLSRFDEWRGSFSESYHSAYISLCLPKLLSPLIRHQLLGWTPLKEGEDFEALPWYSAVETFCHGQGYEESENADKKTLPAIIEKTLLPKTQAFVELVWDPLSSRESACLAELCHRLKDDYSVFVGEQTKPVKAFIEAVSGRLRSSVDEDVFIPLYPKKFLDDRSSPQCQFREQQFWTAVKLLGNMRLWDGVVPEPVLQELMLDKLLNRYLMMTLLNEADEKISIHKCKKVSECFPKSWFADGSISGSPLSQLKSLSSHLLQTAHSICKHQETDAASTRAVMRDVLGILGSIKAWDSVTTIVEKYHYKDLLDSLNLS